MGKAVLDWRAVLAPNGRYSALVHLGSSPAKVARHCSGLAYLAAPYSSEVTIRQSWRIERSARVETWALHERTRLLAAGVTSVCPTIDRAGMSYTAGMMQGGALDPMDADLWARWSQPMLNVSALIVVPEIDGWNRCPDVWAAVVWALDRNTPVHVYGGKS